MSYRNEMSDRTGRITCEEAREILGRYNASHFRIPDQEHARYTIPADPRRDDDIRLGAFITQAELLHTQLSEAVRLLHMLDRPGASHPDVTAFLDRVDTRESKVT